MENKKTVSLRLRVEPQQALALAEMAALYDMKVSDYVRMIFTREAHILDVWRPRLADIKAALQRENSTEQ